MKVQGYRILEKEGEYEGLCVYRAVIDGGDRHVQIRVFPAVIKRFPLILEQFRSTFSKLSHVQHSGICPVITANTNADNPFIVVPHVVAGSLEHRLRSGFYSALDVGQIVDEIAASLEYAHQNGLLHGNLTPDNVLIDEDGHVHIVGFGEAAILKALPSAEAQSMRRLAKFGPPELDRASKLSPATDQYSLALITLRLLTGLPAEDAVEALKSDIVKLQSHNARATRLTLDLSSQLLEELNRALAEQPSKRFNSITEMNHALQYALGAKRKIRPAPVGAVEPVLIKEQPRRKKRKSLIAPIMMGVVLFGVMVSVVAAQWIGSGEPGETTENIVAATPGGIDLPDERPEESDLSENSTLVRASTPSDSIGADGAGGNEKMTATPTIENSGGPMPPTSQPASTNTQPPGSNPTNPPPSTETPTPEQTETPAISETPGPSATPTPTNPSPTDTPLPTSTATVPPPTSTSTPPPNPTIDPSDCDYKKKKKPNFCTPSP